MAIMVTVDKRGTDVKKQIRKAAHSLNKKLKYSLYFSILVNLGLIVYVIKHILTT